MPQGGKNNAPHKGKKTPQGGKVAHKGKVVHKNNATPQGGKVAHKGKVGLREPQWKDMDKVTVDQIDYIDMYDCMDVAVIWRPSGCDNRDFVYDESDVEKLETALKRVMALPHGSESYIKIPICGGRYWASFRLIDGKLSARQVNSANRRLTRHMERSAVHVG
tara:strand:+ start:3860 stop:4348 length:489 start_codon:yes stop_codon:yes gene_type:complete